MASLFDSTPARGLPLTASHAALEPAGRFAESLDQRLGPLDLRQARMSAALGLKDRGVIRQGAYADLVLFDPEIARPLLAGWIMGAVVGLADTALLVIAIARSRRWPEVSTGPIRPRTRPCRISTIRSPA